MKIALIGATGMVGGVMLKVMAERKFPLTDLILVASHKSVGKSISWQGKEYVVQSLDQARTLKPDIALFSAKRVIQPKEVLKLVIFIIKSY